MEEKFNRGDRVYLIHLQEEGTVTGQNGSDMVNVRLADMEIPVYLSDLTKKLPTLIENSKGEEAKERVIQNNALSQNSVIDKKESGVKSDPAVFISFEPVKDRGGHINEFKVSLVNNTSFPLSFRYYLHLNGEINFQLEKIALPGLVFLLHEIEYDMLNEMPVAELHVRDVMNSSIKADLKQKIKPQNFFNKLGKMPVTGTEAYIYKLNLVSLSKKEQPEIQVDKVVFDPDALKQMMTGGVTNKDNELSTADAIEIDLHIEALAHDHLTMENADMLPLQLARFQRALDRAIAKGVDKFYAIHGIGTGKLKKEIHLLLKNYKEVKSFNNDYHPKYGYGATEIILK